MHTSSGSTIYRLGAIVAVVAVLALSLYSAGLSSYLPWLVLAACPLLHMFTHRHHGGHSKERASQEGSHLPAETITVDPQPSPRAISTGESNEKAQIS